MHFKRLPHIDAPGLIQHIVFCTHTAHRDENDAEAMGRSPGGRFLIGALADHVQDVLLSQQGETYIPFAWCVMPNHVHVLVQPRAKSIAQLIKAWKALSSRRSNAPKPLWQKNYFDRYMRDEEQVWFTSKYIEANPVAAGLVERAEQWRWSSAWKERRR